MRRAFIGSIVLVMVLAGGQVQAQSFDVQQLILDVEKLSTLKATLTDMKQGYQLIKNGYDDVRSLSEGSFNLHKAFLNGLLAVSPAVKGYVRIVDIVDLQAALVTKYQQAWGAFQKDGHFTPAELVLIGEVYSGLFSRSVKALGDLANVLTAGTMRASDAERIAQIDRIYESVLQESVFLDRFNNTTGLLAQQRTAEGADLGSLQNMYK
jgi:hypothetical protein